MIIRILTEGQWTVDPAALADLNQLDADVEKALKDNDQEALDRALGALLAEVRDKGEAVPDDIIVESDLILPSQPATVEEVRAFLQDADSDEGLIPDAQG